MANTTDTDLAPLTESPSDLGTVAPDPHSESTVASPFRSPDQLLYQSDAHHSPNPEPAVAPDATPYEGRHRAAE
jgi:hypothetical protein